MTKPLLLQAFDGTNTTVPVWFMRQAGRYLPQYRAIREKHSLDEMFSVPEIVAEVTCQPVDLIGVDAAILFADILTLPQAMGMDIHFDNVKGPVIDTAGRDSIHDIEGIEHVTKSIRLVKERLGDKTPLIGFAGAPFTVLTYLIEGGSSVSYQKTFRFIQEQPEAFHRLMGRLTQNTIAYYQMQKEAGIDVFQLFDSWAGILRPTDYFHFVLPYVQQIFDAISVPSIYYVRNSHYLLPLMDKSGADFLSVCHTVVIGHHVTLEHTQKGIQGNLFTGLLYADKDVLKKEVDDILLGAQKHQRFIFNLGHGVAPDVDPAKLKFIVECVHNFKWQ